jgi:hypothetical protein
MDYLYLFYIGCAACALLFFGLRYCVGRKRPERSDVGDN